MTEAIIYYFGFVALGLLLLCIILYLATCAVISARNIIGDFKWIMRYALYRKEFHAWWAEMEKKDHRDSEAWVERQKPWHIVPRARIHSLLTELWNKGGIMRHVAIVNVVCQGKILLVHNADYERWSVPGGKAEESELWADAARRELFEETGIKADMLMWELDFPIEDKMIHVYSLKLEEFPQVSVPVDELCGFVWTSDPKSYDPLEGICDSLLTAPN